MPMMLAPLASTISIVGMPFPLLLAFPCPLTYPSIQAFLGSGPTCSSGPEYALMRLSGPEDPSKSFKHHSV